MMILFMFILFVLMGVVPVVYFYVFYEDFFGKEQEREETGVYGDSRAKL
jgi:hypothetical protein